MKITARIVLLISIILLVACGSSSSDSENGTNGDHQPTENEPSDTSLTTQRFSVTETRFSIDDLDRGVEWTEFEGISSPEYVYVSSLGIFQGEAGASIEVSGTNFQSLLNETIISDGCKISETDGSSDQLTIWHIDVVTGDYLMTCDSIEDSERALRQRGALYVVDANFDLVRAMYVSQVTSESSFAMSIAAGVITIFDGEEIYDLDDNGQTVPFMTSLSLESRFSVPSASGDYNETYRPGGTPRSLVITNNGITVALNMDDDSIAGSLVVTDALIQPLSPNTDQFFLGTQRSSTRADYVGIQYFLKNQFGKSKSWKLSSMKTDGELVRISFYDETRREFVADYGREVYVYFANIIFDPSDEEALESLRMAGEFAVDSVVYEETSGAGDGENISIDCENAWLGDSQDVQVALTCQTACLYESVNSEEGRTTSCSILSGYGATSNCSACP